MFQSISVAIPANDWVDRHIIQLAEVVRVMVVGLFNPTCIRFSLTGIGNLFFLRYLGDDSYF